MTTTALLLSLLIHAGVTVAPCPFDGMADAMCATVDERPVYGFTSLDCEDVGEVADTDEGRYCILR
jgi:hypothetical protein